eukprot:scaffold64257_cov40-Phaeocystis_antarctica.AAC.1
MIPYRLPIAPKHLIYMAYYLLLIFASSPQTVACSAGLAADLPVWGLQLRGDAEWAVRALPPQ